MTLSALNIQRNDDTSPPERRFPVEVLTCPPWPSAGFIAAWQAVILTDGNGLGVGLDVKLDGFPANYTGNRETQAPPGPNETAWLAIMRQKGLWPSK